MQSLKPLGGDAPQIAAPPTAPIDEHAAEHDPFGKPPVCPDALDRLQRARAPLGTVQACTNRSVIRSACGSAVNVTLDVSHASPALSFGGTHMPTSSPLMSLHA